MSGRQKTPATCRFVGDAAICDPLNAPQSVHKIRVLGEGRAATAVLVEAEMSDGRREICVEKVFSAGWLTRTIYRLSFQAPFAYQSNRDAILACYYRRRVAAAVLQASNTGVDVATPLYVRYDQASQSWVLAAKWINGRGIRPAPADRYRLRRKIANRTHDSQSHSADEISAPEITALLESMHELERMFKQCGLVGSGWQVAPGALVSTANLLRVRDHYTVVDLESGIPAVLVPKYLWSGLRRSELPPFDDLDSHQLTRWLKQNQTRLQTHLGLEDFQRLQSDVEQLLKYSSLWKQSEVALARRPWRLLRRDGLKPYQQHCISRWKQEKTIDAETAAELSDKRWKARLIWYAGLLPGGLGRMVGRMIGNRKYRHRMRRYFFSRDYRKALLEKVIRDRQAEWVAAERLPPAANLTRGSLVVHQLLQSITPCRTHRFLTDRNRRAKRSRQAMLLLLSSRYQAWAGHEWIEGAIEKWLNSKRLNEQEAKELRQQLSGHEVRAYVRGFGGHLALKTFSPFIAPVKYGGLAAFIASGNYWFLLPMLVMPAFRTAATLASWWSTRAERIPHGEALLVGLLPIVGSLAFPLQMFSRRSELSVFLIRDAASKLGRCVPIYGGPNSRTEIAMIRSTDLVIELLDTFSMLTRKLSQSESTSEASEANESSSIPIITSPKGWIDRLAVQQILEDDSVPEKEALLSEKTWRKQIPESGGDSDYREAA